MLLSRNRKPLDTASPALHRVPIQLATSWRTFRSLLHRKRQISPSGRGGDEKQRVKGGWTLRMESMSKGWRAAACLWPCLLRQHVASGRHTLETICHITPKQIHDACETSSSTGRVHRCTSRKDNWLQCFALNLCAPYAEIMYEMFRCIQKNCNKVLRMCKVCRIKVSIGMQLQLMGGGVCVCLISTETEIHPHSSSHTGGLCPGFRNRNGAPEDRKLPTDSYGNWKVWKTTNNLWLPSSSLLWL